jgi:hypothetical protein
MKATMRHLLTYSCVALAAIILAGCAHHYDADAVADPYGFFAGIWHGIIFPLTLVANIVSWVLSLIGISLWENIQIVGRPNTGVFYYIGFVIGLSSLSGASANNS